MAKRNQAEGRVVTGEGWRKERDVSPARLRPTEGSWWSGGSRETGVRISVAEPETAGGPEGVAEQNQAEGRVVSGEGWGLERDLSPARLMPTEAMRFCATAMPLPLNSPPDSTPLELNSGGELCLTVEDARYPPWIEVGTKESFSSSRSDVSTRYGPRLEAVSVPDPPLGSPLLLYLAPSPPKVTCSSSIPRP